MSTVAPQGVVSSCATPVVLPECRTIGGVLFDAPDVLYDATHWRRWLFQLLVRLGSAGTFADFCRDWETHLVDVHRGRREFAEALQSLLLSRGLTWGQIDEIEAASRIQRQALELDVRPLAGVIRTIAELQRHDLPLAAWADAPLTAAKLAERLERLLPQARFCGVLTSLELECAQPEPACYQAMAGSLGVPPAEVLYVGHDGAHLAAATAAGMQTVAVNHQPTAQADYLLPQLDGLVEIVRNAKLARRSEAAAAPTCGVRQMMTTI